MIGSGMIGTNEYRLNTKTNNNTKKYNDVICWYRNTIMNKAWIAKWDMKEGEWIERKEKMAKVGVG